MMRTQVQVPNPTKEVQVIKTIKVGDNQHISVEGLLLNDRPTATNLFLVDEETGNKFACDSTLATLLYQAYKNQD